MTLPTTHSPCGLADPVSQDCDTTMGVLHYVPVTGYAKQRFSGWCCCLTTADIPVSLRAILYFLSKNMLIGLTLTENCSFVFVRCVGLATCPEHSVNNAGKMMDGWSCFVAMLDLFISAHIQGNMGIAWIFSDNIVYSAGNPCITSWLQSIKMMTTSW